MANDNSHMGDELGKQAASAARTAANAAQTARAAAEAVKGAAKVGSSAAKVAAGTAVGGPAGAAVQLALAFKEPIIKTVITVIVLFFLFMTVLIEALPSIVMNDVLGLNGVQPTMTVEESYRRKLNIVVDTLERAHENALESVKRMITDGGYDMDRSLEEIADYARWDADYDPYWILAAYTVSVGQRNTSETDLISEMYYLEHNAFPIYSEVMSTEVSVPVTYTTYKAVTIKVIDRVIQIGGKPYYTLKNVTYYTPSGTEASDVPITQTNYTPVTVQVPIYLGSTITGTRSATYYQPSGSITYYPETTTVKYLSTTIGRFSEQAVIDGFNIDMLAEYGDSGITNEEAIEQMASNLKKTLYGEDVYSTGSGVFLEDQELIAFVQAQNCNDTRKYILSTALSLVGKVDYFWGGKSDAGWNEEWGTPHLVTSAGSSSTGSIRPYGLDCSGFTDWVYKTALGISIGAGTSGQFPNCTEISASDLLPGDLGFLASSKGGWQHVLMFAGYDENGTRKWVHCTSGSGVVLNTPKYENQLVFARPNNIDYETPVDVSSALVSDRVNAYASVVREYASKYGMSQYQSLILAVMMQESGGRGGDVMQCSACGYNTTGETITDPNYSIECGIQYLRDCLNAAGVTDPTDIEHIKLALQGYNYGQGYISWALRNYGGYSAENALAFSNKKKQELGVKRYGDPEYVPHVLRYYSTYGITTQGD